MIKKHQNLEADVAHHLETIEQITKQDENFLNSDHFMKDDLHEKAMNVVKRYHSLHEPMSIRSDNLEDSQLLHQFLRDADDEIQWLSEKQHVLSSNDLGNNLIAVQLLQKKHQALEAEISSQEPIISSLIHRGQQMIQNSHYASEEIEKCNRLVQTKLAAIRDLASVRRLRLLDAIDSQEFYTEVSEVESWMNEKKPILVSSEFGKDEDAVLSQQKKFDALQREMNTYEGSIQKVVQLGNGLVERGHFDKDQIRSKSEKVQSQFEEMKSLSKNREKNLFDQLRYLEFIREVEDLQEWIAEQMTVASSEEYGTDVEHIEQLIIAFDSFISTVSVNETRLQQCISRGDELIKQQNCHEKTIKVKSKETLQMWHELKELINARQEALAGAKSVHMYDRTADETISWINEKLGDVLSEDYGQDLESIQALLRKHEGFGTEIAAVREQVDQVQSEAKKLVDAFPDAKEHIEVKREETVEAWSDLFEKSQQRKEKLAQAEQLQVYFDEYRELLAWINEMLAKITAPELAKDVKGAELLILKIKEHQTEIDSREETFNVFYKAGQKLIKEEHFLASEVEERIRILEQRKKLLDTTLVNRKNIYELNLDTRLFLRDVNMLENWMDAREIQLKDKELGESILHVEELMRKHDDFEKTINAQEDKFSAIKRITLLEQLFRKQREEEEAAKRAEKERVEKERIENLKQKEVKRIEERRRNEELAQKSELEKQQQQIINSGIKPSASSDSVNQVQKSNSFINMFGDRLRRGSEGNTKRAESMKVTVKTPKRTPSFTTRKRQTSFRKGENADQYDLPPVEIQGMLDRKHDLQSGGKRAPVRSWKPFYTVLCGQLLCFFKDEDDFHARKASAPPVNILNARCEKAEDYTKKRNVFRLNLPDGSEFLFLASSLEEMNDWVNKIAFHANLPPNLQLMSFDESMKVKHT